MEIYCEANGNQYVNYWKSICIVIEIYWYPNENLL